MELNNLDLEEVNLSFTGENSSQNFWQRDPSEITIDEISDLYTNLRQKTTTTKFLHHIHVNINNDNFKATGILYVPEENLTDILENNTSMENKVKLYVNGVEIETTGYIVPKYFCFLYGVIEINNVYSEDFICNNMVRFLTAHFMVLRTKEREKYDTFYKNYSNNLKYGVMNDEQYCRNLSELLQFETSKSTEEEKRSFRDYFSDMDPEQPAIFYITGERSDELSKTPYVEGILDNNYEIIYMTDMVDEYIVDSICNYRKYPLVSITREDIPIDLDPELKSVYKEVEESYEGVCSNLLKLLENQVSKVRISRRLTESPCVALSTIMGMSPNMERIIRSQDCFKKTASLLNRKILELNPNHILIHALHELHDENKKEAFNKLGNLLYETCLIAGGIQLYKPNDFVETIHSMIAYNLNINEDCVKDPDEIDVHLPSTESSSEAGTSVTVPDGEGEGGDEVGGDGDDSEGVGDVLAGLGDSVFGGVGGGGDTSDSE